MAAIPSSRPLRVLLGGLPLALVLAACGGSSSSVVPTHDGGRAHDTGTEPADGGSPSPDSGGDGSHDGGTPPGMDSGGGGNDGTPSYTASCTPLSQQNGTAINTNHGRLDGFLSYVVPKGGPGQCNGDDSHVHLQVRMTGNVYDVAVDIGRFTGDVLFYESDLPLPAGAWTEGWHGNGNLDYTQLGLHSGQFTPEDPTALSQKIQTELASANHISVFGISYPTGNGCHDVHYYNGGGQDGAIFIDPLSSNAHGMFFHFSTQSF